MSKLLSVNNSKLKASGAKKDLVFVSFGIPAALTCPGASICKTGCYALSGTYLFKSVREARQRNYEATLQHDFVANMAAEIAELDAKHPTKVLCIRIHDSGDFYGAEYRDQWIELAEMFPHVIFYAYTKSIFLFNGTYAPKTMPDNFRVIQSLGGKFDATVNMTLPHAKVFETVEALEAAGYTNASEDDSVAIFGGTKIGLVFHHAKSFKNTKWGEVA